MPPEQEHIPAQIPPAAVQPPAVVEHKILWVAFALVGLMLFFAGTYFFLYQESVPQALTVGENQEIASSTAAQPAAPILNGYVYFEYFNTNTWTEDDNGLVTTLKYFDVTSSTTKNLIELSDSKGQAYPASLFSVYRNTIYFVDAAGRLTAIDATDLTRTRTIAIGLEPGEFVSDYLFDGDRLYYLAGPFCNSYRAICNNTFRSVEMGTGEVRTIATGIDKAYIAGFDAARANLYFSWGWGDAGCHATKVSGWNLATNKVSDVRSFSGCAEEPGTDIEAIRKQEKEFFDALAPKKTDADHLIWNGSIFSQPLDSIESKQPELDSSKSYETIQVY